MIQELRLLLWRSRICWRWASCAGEGTWGAGVWGVGLDPGGAWGPVGRDSRRRRLRAGDRLYFTFAWTSNSLKICDTLMFSFAEASTNPFSQSTVTTDSVVWNSTCRRKKFQYYDNTPLVIKIKSIREVSKYRFCFLLHNDQADLRKYKVSQK